MTRAIKRNDDQDALTPKKRFSRWRAGVRKAIKQRFNKRIRKEWKGMDAWSANEDGAVIGYMCAIDWEYELGLNFIGNRIYPSIDALREGHKCADDCGIVEVEVRLRRIVTEGTGR